MASSFLAKAIHRKSLLDLLDIHLAKQALLNNEHRACQLVDPVGFHPSQIGACLRSVFYGWCGVPMNSNLPKPKTQRIFGNGDHYHTRMQNYFRDMGILEGQWICKACRREWKGLAGHCPHCGADTRAQKYDEIDFKKGWMIGACDGVVSLADRRICIELKSINTRDFSTLKKPLEKHIEQGNCYMWALDIPECAFIYEDKNTQEIKIFIERQDDKIVKAILKRIDTYVKDFWEKKILPPRECEKPDWCAYQHECYIAKRTASELLKERDRIIKERDIKNGVKEALKTSVGCTITNTTKTIAEPKIRGALATRANGNVDKKPLLTSTGKANLLKRQNRITK